MRFSLLDFAVHSKNKNVNTLHPKNTYRNILFFQKNLKKGIFLSATVNSVAEEVSLIYSAKISIWKWIIAGAHISSNIRLKIKEFRSVRPTFMGWIWMQKSTRRPNLILPFQVHRTR